MELIAQLLILFRSKRCEAFGTIALAAAIVTVLLMVMLFEALY